nr:MAG TPA: hypothetical protein [Caudoviricetes sp.]
MVRTTGESPEKEHVQIITLYSQPVMRLNPV